MTGFDLDSLFDRTTPAPSPPNIFRTILENQREQADELMVQNFAEAAKADPFKAAEARSLGIELGLDALLVERNIERVRELKRQKHARMLAVSQQSPILRRQLRDPAFARLAHEDLEPLSIVEGIAKGWETGQLTTERGFLGERVRRGIATRGQIQRLAAVNQRLQELPAASDGMFMASSRFIGQMSRTLPKAVSVGVGGGTGAAATVGLLGSFGPQVAIPEELVTVPGAFAFGFRAAFISQLAVTSFQIEAGNAFLDMRDEGLSEDRASNAAVVVGAINALLEVVGVGLATAPLRKNLRELLSKKVATGLFRPTRATATARFVIDMAAATAGEATTEILQEVSNIGGEFFAGGKPDDIAGRLAAIAEETVKGMILLSVPGAGLNFSSRVRKVRQAEAAQGFYEDLAKGVAATDTVKLAPDAFAQFLQASAEGTAVENLYIQPQRLEEALQEAGISRDQLGRVLPGIEERLDKALESGGDVVIPTSEYQTRVANRPELDKALRPHLRIDSDAISGAEAQFFQKNRSPQSEAARQLVEIELKANESFQASSDLVHDEMLAQITATGKFRPREARALALSTRSFVETQAASLGITPEEYNRRFPLTIKTGKTTEQFPAGEFTQKAPKTTEPSALDQMFEEGPRQLPAREQLFQEGGILGIEESVSEERRQAAERRQAELGPPGGTEERRVAREERRAAPSPLRQMVQEGGELGVEQARDGLISVKARRERAMENRRDDEFQQQGGTKGPRGGFNPEKLTATLYEDANVSTFLHETAHYYLEVLTQIAAGPNPPARVVNDIETFLKWADGGTLQEWLGKSLKERRKVHETWAFSFELYMFEGKAPTRAMEDLYTRFRRWLTNLYGQVRDELNGIYRQEFGEDLPLLTPEMRGVFDRLLATDEAISLAEETRSMAPHFQTQAQAGATDEDWARYQDALELSHELGVTGLHKDSLRQLAWFQRMESRELKKLQAEQDEARTFIREEEAEAVRRMPIYRALHYLKTGEFTTDLGEVEPAQIGAHRMATEDVRSLLPEDRSLRDLAGLTTKEGVRPDDVAQNFGFTSGQQLIDELLTVQPQQELVNQLTDERMLLENGDMLDAASVEAAIDKALHNEVRARFLAVEWKFLTKSTQPVRLIMGAAKIAAQDALLETKVGEIRPRDFSVAEGRAARESREASAAGDSVLAREKHLQQRLQHHLTTESQKVVSKLEKVIDRRTGALRGVFKLTQRLDSQLAKRRNVDFVGAARAILQAFGLGKPETAKVPHLAMVKEYAPQRHADLLDLVNNATQNAGPWKEVTLEDFLTMQEAVEALWFLARRDKVVDAEGRRVEVGEASAEIVGAIDAPPLVDRRRPLSEKESRALRNGNWRAWVTRVESWVVMMDGGTPGNVHKWLFQPLREAFNNYQAERIGLTKILKARMDELNLGDGQSIAAPELNFSFNNKAELIGALKHAGNLSNLRKLILGERMIPEQVDGSDLGFDVNTWWDFIDRMIDQGVLTSQDFEYVQFVWDTYEDLLPRLQAAHFESMGFRFEEIPAEAIQVQFPGEDKPTVFRGGYVPATVDNQRHETRGDPVRGEDPLAANSKHIRDQLSARKGFTFSRVEWNRPLKLSIRSDAHHLDEHLRFLHMEVASKDVLRLLRDKDVASAITQIDPNVIDDMFLPWLAGTVTNSVLKRNLSPTWWEGQMIFLRKATGAGIMFAKLTTGMQQTTGLGQSLIHVELKYLRSSSAAFLQGGQGARAFEKSTFMRLRIKEHVGQIRDDIDVITKPGWMTTITEWTDRHAFFLQRWMQSPVDVITWNARYEQGIAQDLTEKQAVAAADSAVRLSQGSGTAPDISRFERNSPGVRLLLQFSNFWFTQFNAISTRKGSEKVKAIAVTTVFAGLVAGLVVQVLKGGWDDENDDGNLWDDVAWWALFESAQGAIAANVPVFGPAAVQAITGQFGGGGRVTLGGAGLSTLGTALRSLRIPFDMLIDNYRGDEIDFGGTQIKDIANLLTLLTGLPLTQFGRQIAYGVDVAQDEVQPEEIFGLPEEVDYIRGLLVGQASEASR